MEVNPYKSPAESRFQRGRRLPVAVVIAYVVIIGGIYAAAIVGQFVIVK